MNTHTRKEYKNNNQKMKKKMFSFAHKILKTSFSRALFICIMEKSYKCEHQNQIS